MELPHDLQSVLNGNRENCVANSITSFYWSDIGFIPVTSGRIAPFDPMMLGTIDAFEHHVETGNYALRLLIASFNNGDERVAASILVLDDGLPTSWQIATLDNGDPDFSVDSGTAGLADMDAINSYESELDDNNDYFQQVADAMDESYQHTRSWAIHAVGGDRDCCIAAYSSGHGDGCYTSYWGRSNDSSLTWLLTDFEMLSNAE